MAEVIITDFEDIENCPMCSGLLRVDDVRGTIMKRCGVDRGHGYFFVKYLNYETGNFEICYRPWAP